MYNKYLPFCLAILHHPETNTFPLYVLESPSGETGTGKDLFLPPLQPLELVDTLTRLASRPSFRHGKVGSRDLIPVSEDPLETRSLARNVGNRLFDALFTNSIRLLYERSLHQAELEDFGLRVELRLDPANPALATLARYPWELLCKPSHTPLSLSPRTPLVRHLALDRSLRLTSIGHPLRVLLVASNPQGTSHLDLEHEAEILSRELAGIAAVTRLPRPTWRWLQEVLSTDEYDILHFMGHGGFEAERGEGYILFEGEEDGRSHAVTAQALALTVQQSSSIRLIVMNACKTGKPGTVPHLNPFGGVAEALVQQGVPAVVAMQFPISDAAALEFAAVFYEHLAEHQPVEAAVTESRLAMRHTNPHVEWAAPVLYLRGRHGWLFGGLVEESASTKSTTSKSPSHHQEPGSSRFVGLLQYKTRYFVNRESELGAIDEFLRQNACGFIFVTGSHGVGKSSLLAKLVRQRGYVHHFDIRTEGLFGSRSRVVALQRQLLQRYPLPRRLQPVDEPPKTIEDLLIEIARHWRIEAPIVFVVDLERAPLTTGATSSLAGFGLPSSLPTGVYCVVGTDLSDLLPNVQDPHLQLELGRLPEDIGSIKEYLKRQFDHSSFRTIVTSTSLTPDNVVELLAKRSSGNFLCAYFISQEVKNGNLLTDFPEQIPSGLEDYLLWKWRSLRAKHKTRWRAEFLPVLLALKICGKPLDHSEIAVISGVENRSRLFQVLKEWQPLIQAGALSRPAEGLAVFRIEHECVLEAIRQKQEHSEERDDLARAQRIVEERLRQLLRQGRWRS